MCGISGIFGRNNEQHHQVGASIEMLSHRGPDFWDAVRVNDQLSLAHSRLAIVDLNERSNQPMSDRQTGNWLAYNGEIYNYKELKKQLPDREFLTNSDTEVLLYLLTDLGIESINQCNGMFAFAFWNDEEKSLTLCRDRFGQKPLFYSLDQDGLAFASEAKAFQPYGIELRPNHAAFVNFLFEITVGRNEHSFFDGIKQIRNGTLTTFRSDVDGEIVQLEEKRFWNYPTKVERATYEEATAEFKSIFEDSVRIRRSDEVECAIMLSGGLDSSAATSFAANLDPNIKMTSISAVYPGDAKDEGHFARLVPQAYDNIDAHWIDNIDFELCKSSIDDVIYHQECPISDGSIVAQHVLMQRIAELGIKVILSGNGGDEVLAGYPAIYGPAAKIAALKKGKLRFPDGRVLLHLLSDRIKNWLYVKKHARLGLLSDHQVLENIWPKFENFGHEDLMNDYLINGIEHWTLPNLMWYEDRNAMAASVENRCPFLDVRLVEFLLRQPAWYKIENGYTKRILRDASKGILPDEIAERTDKQGFHAPVDAWVREIGDDFLHDQTFADAFPYLDLDRIAMAPFRIHWRVYTMYLWFYCFCQNKVAKHVG